jgi:hypothetical protein
MKRRWLFRTMTALLAFSSVLYSCVTEKPAPPVPVMKPREETPDVVKIAVRFVESEGLADVLFLESAFVEHQDDSAYYIGFARRNGGKTGVAVVKVFKRDGWAEWEEY